MARGNHDGFEKEPPSRSGRPGGRHPLVHSHGMRPTRKISARKRHGKRG